MARPNYNSNGTSKEEAPKAKITKETLQEALLLFKYIKPYRWKFIWGLIFIGLSGGTTMAFPYLLKQLIDSANNLSKGIAISQTPTTIALLMLGVLTIQMVFSFLRVYLFTFVGEHALGDLRKDIYKHMLSMSMDFFSNRRVGELSNRISTDVSQIQDAVTTVFAELLRGLLILIIGICLIFYLSAKLTFLMLSIVPVIAVIAVVFSKRIRQRSREAQDQLAESGTIVQETLQAIANVKAFSNENFESKRYGSTIDKVVQLAIANGILRGSFIAILLFSVFGVVVLVVWFGTGLMQQGQLSFGDLTAFVVYTAFVGGTMAGFADMYSQLQKTLGATQRVRELLRETGESILLISPQDEAKYRLSGKVTLQNIAFSYPSRPEMLVLKNVSIQANAGQQIAIVGSSGAGKSTLAALLLRFYEPQQGQIYFDQFSTNEIPLKQLRQQMALVPQDIILFGGTIKENIAYGKPDASFEEILEAAKKANAHQFVNAFPEGYETIVGERGVKLSGGQRQRIAIARAILKDPVILILDEATSALDSASEQLVQEALLNLMKNRTSFVIAHRLSTIRNADKIVVLENGLVKEEGTHQELMQLENGLYQKLITMQQQ